MSFNTTLTTGQYETLRGTSALAPSYQSGVFASLCPNTILFQALVNQASFAASFAQVTFDNVTVGAYTDIVVGMTVIISPTTDLSGEVFTGRARADNSGVVATSTILNINETSAAVANDYVITVIDDFRLWDKLGRQVNSVQYVDYAITFRQLLPVVYGLKSAYAGWVSSGVLTISFTPSAIATTSGASISSWAWDVQDGTITVGSASTQNITATFPPGHRWIYLTVTDSGGRTITRRVSIHAHDPNLYPPIPLLAGDISVSANIESGYEASITAWDGVEDVLDNTLIVIWNDELYQDGETALTGDNIAFVGRFRQSSDSSLADPVHAIVAETRYTIESALQALSRLEMLPYEFLNKGTPTKFFHVKNLTLWRAVCLLLSEFSTFTELHDLSFDSTADTFITVGLRTQGNNILAAVNDLYYSINGGIQINAAAQAQCVRDLRMVSTSLRNAAVTVGNWTTADLLSIDSYDHPNVKTIGRLIATGGSFITANKQNRTFESLAPGIAQDYPEGSASLDRQVLTTNASKPNAQTELNERSGNAFARAQETDQITVTHPDGYAFLVPAIDQWYTFTLDGSETVRGIVLTTATRWLLMSIEVGHNGVTGQKEVHATYTRETQGAAGQTVTYPPAPEIPYEPPSFPPFDVFPAFPTDPSLFLPPDEAVMPFDGNPDLNQTTAPLDGNGLAVIDSDNNTLYVTANLLTNGSDPDWTDITPDNLTGDLKHVVTPGGSALYVVGNDGTDSSFHYTENAYANPVVWVDTTLTAELYDYIRPASTSGAVYLEGYTTGGVLTSIWSVKETYGVETGRTDTVLTVEAVYDGATQYNCIIWTGGSASSCGYIGALDAVTLVGSYTASQVIACGGTFPGSLNGAFIGGCLNYMAFASVAPFTMQFTFTDDPSCGDPLIDQTLVAYSTDFGATFAAPENVLGISPSGFDTIKIGIPTLLGSSGQVYISTTAGGAYTPYGTLFPAGGEPNAIYLNRFQFGGASVDNVTTNTPQYLVGSGTLSNSGHALWKNTTSGSLFTGITPTLGGTGGVVIGRDSVVMPWQSGARILDLADFGSSVQLAVSVNSGSSWKFSGALSANAYPVRLRKGDLQNKQAFFGNGTVIGFVANYQAATLTVDNKNYPGGAVSSIEVFG